MKYIAFTTKGLEKVSLMEILHALNDVEICDIKDKRVIFETKADPKLLLTLKTVDDIGILLANVNHVADYDHLIAEVDNLDLISARDYLKSLRQIKDNQFSLTVGLASSKFKSAELTKIISAKIHQKYHWQYNELNHSNFDIRIFIDHDQVIASVRLTKDSLQHRLYKTLSKPGSLKPTIAAAMVQLATNFQTDLKVVDNFCGSGTILCESYLPGNQVYGGDINSESVVITRHNLRNLGFTEYDHIKPLDATHTVWPDHFFDCAISNLPWDKQIEINSITRLYEESIREYHRVLKPTVKLCVLVSKPDLFIKYVKKFWPDSSIQTLKIGLLGQNPTIILVNIMSQQL